MERVKKVIATIISTALLLTIGLPCLAAVNDTGFADVAATAWYAGAVTYCRDHGLMSGTGNSNFSPEGTASRAMLVTVLYRQAGSPAVTSTSNFTDVPANAYYKTAVDWGASTGLVSGYGNGRFGSGDPVTRQDLAAFLWRAEGRPTPGQIQAFADANLIADYAVSAVNWAREKGIISGKGNNRFDPRGHATRAEMASMLMRWVQGKGETPTPSPVPGEDGYALITEGTFQMGSPAGEPERSPDEVQHSVTVDSFYMSKTEVSQREYQAVMGANPSDTQGNDLPVTNITWYDAVNYCNRLSEAAGLTPCYTISGTTVTWDKSTNGYRLPTEAEWEYAARANTTTPFSFGDYVHNSDANCYNAYGYNNDASGSWVNGSDTYLRHTVAVDSYNANGCGLYNMHGNAAEWVWDWYGSYETQTAANPTGPESGNAKIVRGGGWNDHPKHIRSAYRGAQPADVPLYSISVRPVRNAGTASGEVKSTYSATAEQKTGKTLIVYFSQTGNTEGLANLIHDMSGADIFRLERATPYASSSNGPVLYGEALNELRAEATPELKEWPDISQYDTILLGYCNWWSSIPACVRTLLTREDFSGKTIVPFCSMGGGQFGQTISAVAKLAPDSVIKEGLMASYSSYDRAEIQAWLAKNNISH